MAVLGVASITPAFPRVMEALNISPQSVGLLITVFTLPGVLLTPVLGVLADRFGRKKILVPSLMLFGIAGGACFFARDFGILLLLRFFQGIGAASLGSLNITIIGDLFKGRERAAAMGYNASVLSIGTASYPAVGGILATFGWYYPFLLPFVAIPVGFAVLFGLKNPEPRNKESMGEYLSKAFRSVGSLKAMALFSATVSTFIILYGSYLTFFPLLLSLFGAQPFIIGMVMSSMSLTTAITSSQLGRMTRRFQERSLLRAAFVLYSISLLLIALSPSLWILLIPTVLFGIAHGLNLPSIQTLLAELAPMEYRAAFMSVNGMVLRIGQTLGPILMGLIFGFAGMSGVFYAGSILAIFTAVMIAVLIRN